MSRRTKILMVSLALASLASVRCTPSQKAGTHETLDTMAALTAEAAALSKTCDIGIPPMPPHEMFDITGACFTFECPPEVKVKVAAWIFDLTVWVQEARECAVQAQGLIKE